MRTTWNGEETGSTCQHETIDRQDPFMRTRIRFTKTRGSLPNTNQTMYQWVGFVHPAPTNRNDENKQIDPGAEKTSLVLLDGNREQCSSGVKPCAHNALPRADAFSRRVAPRHLPP